MGADTMTEQDTPRVWVGCLACYNAGVLTGEWVDAIEAGDFRPCTKPGHEEWWCLDHEGFGRWLSGECSPMRAQEIAERMAEVEEQGHDLDAVGAYLDNIGGDLASLDVDEFADAFAGHWDSVVEYAEELAEDTAGTPELARWLREGSAPWPFSCIDWEHAARELVLGGDIWTSDAPGGGVFVFRNV